MSKKCVSNDSSIKVILYIHNNQTFVLEFVCNNIHIM